MRKLGVGGVALAFMGTVFACGEDVGTAPDGSSSGGTKKDAGKGKDGSSSTTPPGTIPEAVTSCSGKAALSGDQTVSAGGKDALVHLPPSYDPTKPMPVVLNFHGLNMNGTLQILMTDMTGKADTAGFIAVHPNGTGDSWNGGVCCGPAMEQGLDDVGFTRALLDELSSKLCVDPKRVFATGLSTGGFFSHRLACELSDRIAAIAPVAGLMGIFDCAPARKVSVFQFHGTNDQIVQYNGTGQFGYPSVPTTMAGWAERHGCSGSPTEFLQTGDTHCDRWEGCADGAEVQLCTVDDGGHTWPGGADLTFGALGKTTTAISANDLMWEFFQRHPLP